MNIIPWPAAIQTLPGSFELRPDTLFLAGPETEGLAQLFATTLSPATGWTLRVQTADIQAPPSANVIGFRLDSTRSALGAEGYALSVRPERISITAFKPAGIFYACQTLRQLLPPEILRLSRVQGIAWTFPCTEIQDQPRFAWRGLMLDVARNFYQVAFIKRYLDLMALYKMNRLHLHLTDVQGWTLPIRSYPKITDMSLWPADPGRPRGVYTPAEIRDLVAYGASRQVMIVPEIDFPGHSDLVLACYPEMLCVNHPAKAGKWGHKEYCPGQEEVFHFIEAVITEAAELFDSPYIHIGGDEYFGSTWAACPACQKRLADEQLEAEDTEELQTLFSRGMGHPRKYLLYRYLMRRIAGMVVAKGRIPILWDDLSWRGRFPEKSVILQWHYQGLFDFMQKAVTPENPSLPAALAGHGAIVAAANHHYFDYFDGGKFIRQVYEFEPVPEHLPRENEPLILGPHACLWELPQDRLDAMAFPRTLALAEQGWSEKRHRDWNHFHRRLEHHLPRLNELGVSYSPLFDWDVCRKGEHVEEWSFPVGAENGFFKIWSTKEIIGGDGKYLMAFIFDTGRETTVLEQVDHVDDGTVTPAERLQGQDTSNPSQITYQFTVTGFDERKLYQTYVFFKFDGSAPCKGRLIIKKATP